MAAVLIPGFQYVSCDVDEDSHRTYKIKFKVKCLQTEGPAVVQQCPGLPQYGDQWLVDSDSDAWAFCKYVSSLQPTVTDGVNLFWEVTKTFTTKPDKAYCLENQIEDPLLKPPEVSGGWVKYTEEAVQDRFGNPLVNSAWEQVRGPQVEFDKNRDQVHIEMPVPLLNLGFVQQFKDKVNAFALWGMNPRCVKLSGFKWKKNYYGVCFPYYTWIFDFDLNAEGFDRNILDEGTKVLRGRWDKSSGTLAWIPDPTASNQNPQDFMRFLDYPTGNPSRVILDGYGLPAGVNLGTGTSQPSCGVCTSSSTPAQVVANENRFSDRFVGNYSDYNRLLAQVMIPTSSSCFFGYTDPSGIVAVSCRFEVNSIANLGNVTILFETSDGSIPPATFKATVTGGGRGFNCKQTFDALLVDGDFDQCPADISVVASGSGSTGPPYSGPPGVLHVEKYFEVDFTLLGIPLGL